MKPNKQPQICSRDEVGSTIHLFAEELFYHVFQSEITEN